MSDRESARRRRTGTRRALLGAAIAATSTATACGPAAVEAVRARCAEVGRYSVQPCRVEEVVASCDQVVTGRDGSDEHVTSYYYRREPEEVERILAECRAQPRSQGWPGLPGLPGSPGS